MNPDKATLDAMVNRFLGWKLPVTFSPDAGITFKPYHPDQKPESELWPIGTNLFTADEARKMLEHITAPVVASPEVACGTTIEAIQAEIRGWADTVYPHRTAANIVAKLRKELEELADDVTDPLEYADLLILALDLASINGICAADAVRQKIAINYVRKWEIAPDGEMSHVKEPAT